jgi:hypothetical protein
MPTHLRDGNFTLENAEPVSSNDKHWPRTRFHPDSSSIAFKTKHPTKHWMHLLKVVGLLHTTGTLLSLEMAILLQCRWWCFYSVVLLQWPLRCCCSGDRGAVVAVVTVLLLQWLRRCCCSGYGGSVAVATTVLLQWQW